MVSLIIFLEINFNQMLRIRISNVVSIFKLYVMNYYWWYSRMVVQTCILKHFFFFFFTGKFWLHLVLICKCIWIRLGLKVADAIKGKSIKIQIKVITRFFRSLMFFCCCKKLHKCICSDFPIIRHLSQKMTNIS